MLLLVRFSTFNIIQPDIQSETVQHLQFGVLHNWIQHPIAIGLSPLDNQLPQSMKGDQIYPNINGTEDSSDRFK
jgi:hypothetical protein